MVRDNVIGISRTYLGARLVRNNPVVRLKPLRSRDKLIINPGDQIYNTTTP
jgi:hypothetical protein